jgi:cell division protein FtsI/penicillin-binding protein 2
VVLEPAGEVVHSFRVGVAPQPVRTTIELHLQEAAEAVAATAPNSAALVAIRPSTHEVVAVASAPAGGYPRALVGRYPPGSTFKVVTATALLANGIGPDSPAPCPETADIGGRVFRNAEGAALGDIPFRRAFFESCNTSFVLLADTLEPEQLVAAAEAHGFNRDLEGVGLPVAGGSFPAPEGRIDQAASAIGQGRVLASPLQMAVVAANVASGVAREPRIVDSGPPEAGTPLPEGVAPTLQELMRLVVAEGTATRAQLPGEPVRGKTGTAEFGTQRPPRTHAWFIGYRGDLAVAVVVEDAGFGGQVAAPLARDFLARAG